MSDEKKDGQVEKSLEDLMGIKELEEKPVVPVQVKPAVPTQVKTVVPQAKPVIPASLPKAAPVEGLDPAQLSLLVQVMMQRELRLAQEEELKSQQRIKRDQQREFNAKHHYDAKIERQTKCRHKKGGKNGPKSGVVDYAVFYHTYINNESVIKCMLCGAKWKVNDTDQFLVRNGKNIPNHTKIGWTRALEMVSQSTNTPTSSEIPLMVQSAVAGISDQLPEEIPNID
jgi:hypothetical protein